MLPLWRKQPLSKRSQQQQVHATTGTFKTRGLPHSALAPVMAMVGATVMLPAIAVVAAAAAEAAAEAALACMQQIREEGLQLLASPNCKEFWQRMDKVWCAAGSY